ncbi:hypothetical protein [Agrobacterium tumefaciens]|uniref:hypothetical protein n=1 Tax=Agrobacterium tumefaciens TaxID=358 RepID=UPI001572B845|nr:hypothetical protein [Agrobacterium tumefaciens]NTB01590.1 hypothetical protein [Agrobacterium tumefaciens]
MSCHVYFAFSTGLSKPITAPKGTLSSILSHMEEVESELNIVKETREDGTFAWPWKWLPDDVSDKVLCDVVDDHNCWVRRFYDLLADWSKNPIEGGEEITPEHCKLFWHGLRILDIPPQRWTGDYYYRRMNVFYEVMRGRPSEGITFPSAKLTPKQAGAVVWLFENLLDPDDMRLEVPKGCDFLASSYHGEYEWCERCGAVLDDYAANCRKRGCPVQENWCEDDRPSWYRPAKGGGK